ncbi:YbjN domain-containing protein, partial [Baaleninema sp.]|uniref:YbjN domain-containing protein n=1 Tax=Baaleninema sp. TaxID=3101197 RepID=UPI003CFCD4A6
QPDAALLDTESWLCLSVSQVQASGEVSYRTLWSYLNPDTLASDTPDTEQLSQGILAFISDFTEASLGQVSESFSREILDAASEFVGEVDETLKDNHSENRSDRHAAKEPQRSLLETTIGFFLEDDWSFQRLEGRSVLQLGFEGENGRWSCFAKAREPQQQLVFYSICPVEVPETQRQEMSEFLTRANYGLVIGNFEMDFQDGEIRYKTSLDVENDVLSSALVKNLVYPNLLTMDKYLRGIAAVAKGEMTPTEAIDWVESSSE